MFSFIHLSKGVQFGSSFSSSIPTLQLCRSVLPGVDPLFLCAKLMCLGRKKARIDGCGDEEAFCMVNLSRRNIWPWNCTFSLHALTLPLLPFFANALLRTPVLFSCRRKRRQTMPSSRIESIDVVRAKHVPRLYKVHETAPVTVSSCCGTFLVARRYIHWLRDKNYS